MFTEVVVGCCVPSWREAGSGDIAIGVTAWDPIHSAPLEKDWMRNTEIERESEIERLSVKAFLAPWIQGHFSPVG